MPGEWVTTNGFDCVYYLSDRTQIDIAEQDDETWSLVRTHTDTGEVFEQSAAPDRQTLMRQARRIMADNGLRSVPSEAQRAASWFKGEDYDYTSPGARRREWAQRREPVSVSHRDAASNDQGFDNGRDHPSPKAPEPPAVDPVAQLNAMLTAYKLNELMKPKPAKVEYTCSRGHSPNRYVNGPTCPECGSWGKAIGNG